MVFREPYPKSMALGLHRDALAKEGVPPGPDQVRIEHFVGIAPRRFLDMFSMVPRKDKGQVVDWETNRARSQPRVFSPHPTYLVRMEEAVEELDELLNRTELEGLFEEEPAGVKDERASATAPEEVAESDAPVRGSITEPSSEGGVK